MTQPWVTPADVPPPTPRPDWMTPAFVHSVFLDIVDWVNETKRNARQNADESEQAA